MIPDNIEKIIMTKDDYDRNVEQLLYDKCKAELEVERLNNIINKAIEYIKTQIEDDYDYFGLMYHNDEKDKLLNILKGVDKE